MENEKLATELLHEVKNSATRWFYAFLIICIIEICTIAGFLWYISLPVEEITSTEVTQENGGDNNTMIGVDYGETNSENND